MSKSNYLKQNITAKQARQQADLDAIVAELLETYGIGGAEEKARLEATLGRPIPAGTPTDPPETIDHDGLEVTHTHTGDVSGGFRYGTDYQEIYRYSGLIPPGDDGMPDLNRTVPVCNATSDTLRAELRMRDETRPALKTPLSSAAKILRRDAEEIADRIYAEFGCDAGCGIDGIVQIVEEVLGRFPGRTTCYRPEDLEGQCWVDILPRAPTQALVDETAGRAKTPEQYAALAPARMESLEHDRAAFYCFKPTDAFSRNDMLRWVEECRWPGLVTLALIPEPAPAPRHEPVHINCPCEYIPVDVQEPTTPQQIAEVMAPTIVLLEAQIRTLQQTVNILNAEHGEKLTQLADQARWLRSLEERIPPKTAIPPSDRIQRIEEQRDVDIALICQSLRDPRTRLERLEAQPAPATETQLGYTNDRVGSLAARVCTLEQAPTPLEPIVTRDNEERTRRIVQEEIHIALTRAATNARPVSHRTAVIRERNP